MWVAPETDTTHRSYQLSSIAQFVADGTHHVGGDDVLPLQDEGFETVNR